MNPRTVFQTLERSLLSGTNLIMALTSCTSAISAWRWRRAAEPCVWISNPFGNSAVASVVWNSGLTAVLGFAAAGVLLRETPLRASRIVRIALGLLALRAGFDTLMFFMLVTRGEIVSSLSVPLSLGVFAGLLADVWLLRCAAPSGAQPSWTEMVVTIFGICVGQVLLIALHVLTFGSTDYRREADVAIVLGAQVRSDGTLSLALSDRLDTAADLFREGYVRFVLVSGATGVEGINEATAMRGYLVEAGLPKDRVLVDPDGKNTLATARNSTRLMAEYRLTSALVVTHYFHLARCKLLFEEQGLSVVTVPARMSRRLVLEPYYFARECVGFLWYALTQPLRNTAVT